VIAIVDESVSVDESGGVVPEVAHEAVIVEGEGEDEEEGEGDEVGDLDADDAAFEVVFDEGLFFLMQVVGGVGEAED